MRAFLFCYITTLCSKCTALQGVLKAAASTNDSSFDTGCGGAEEAQTVTSYGHVGLSATVPCACELILLFLLCTVGSELTKK
jgi:hypothetical protein